MFLLVFTLALGFGGLQAQNSVGTPAEQYKAIVKEFNDAAHDLHLRSRSGESQDPPAARVFELAPRLLELAEKNPREPFAFDALVMVITQTVWIENNTKHPGWGIDNPQKKALAMLLRDHVTSDKFGLACWRSCYGFSQECEAFLRTALAKSPHRDVQAQACLRLAQFLNARANRLDLLNELPEMAKRYEGMFGKDYLDELRRTDRVVVAKEVEALYERAANEFADGNLPYKEKVGDRAKTELFELRHLTIGKPAADIDGVDQDGQRFKLSDYRGKVVLLYFWSEY
jgi:hypothetical protein